MSTIAVNAITNAAGGNTATINGMTPTAQSLQGFRNRIINGDMRIDQRNNGASVTPSSGNNYTLDRWLLSAFASSKLSVQRNAGSVTPPSGFTDYLGVTTASAYTPTAGEYFVIGQRIEGFNWSDMGWGTANAQAATLSFWVRSSLTGTHSGALNSSSQTHSYVFAFSVSSANTWEYKTVSVPGPTSGTFATNNTEGLWLNFNLGSGSNFQVAAGSWVSGEEHAATGAVSVVGTNGATFYITGVQLEAGSVASPFERRPYGTELALCQRYYQISRSAGGNYVYVSNWGSNATTTTMRCTFPLKVSLRTSPSSVDFANLCVDDNATAPSVTAVSIYNTSASDSVGLQATVASGLTAYRPAVIANVGGVGYIGLSAEL